MHTLVLLEFGLAKGYQKYVVIIESFEKLLQNPIHLLIIVIFIQIPSLYKSEVWNPKLQAHLGLAGLSNLSPFGSSFLETYATVQKHISNEGDK